MKKVNAAIIGYGRWGQLLFDASQASDNIEVTAAVTRTPAKVEQLCQEQGIALHGQLDAVLEDDNIDALIIATPHSQHFNQLLLAAKAGKHVYCEKPFALDGEQAVQALDALADGGRKIAIGHNRRFAPNTLALKKLIDEGWFGEMVHIDGCFHAHMAQSAGKWRDSVEESPAGGMTSLGIHIVDMFINLMGPVTSLQATSTKVAADCAFDDHTTATLEFENGAKGSLSTFTSTAMRWRITVYGTRGWAELQDLDKLVLQPVEGEQEEISYPGYEYPATKSITAALQSFGGDVLGGEPFPIGPDDIEHGTRILQGIIESSATGDRMEIC